MQLSNKFDKKLVENILQRENAFISHLLDILPMPKSAIERGFDESEVLTNTEVTKLPEVSNATTRVKSIEELQNRLLEIKSKKKLNYKEKLIKRGLKKRLKRNEQRLISKTNRKGPKTVTTEADNNVQEEIEEKKFKPAKPVFNSQGKMVFSKFDFSQMGTKNKIQKQKVKNDPQKLLQNLEKQKNKLKELETSGEQSKAEELKQKLIWRTALAKAEGEKVKDDPELLKKSIKRREQEVEKSKKKWKAREEKVQKAKEEKQKKRTDNINKRKKDKKMKKLKKASKKGKIIPGL